MDGLRVDGERVRQLREARGWPQERLAEAAGLGVRTVQRLEAEGRAALQTRQAVAAALGVSAEELLGPAEALAQPAGVEDTAAASTASTARAVPWLRRSVLIYVLVCGGMVWRDIAANGRLDWAFWPVLFWGLALLRSHRRRVNALKAA